ncbi:MAG: chromosome segregation protein, partial [Opitutales bacterium]|nr:chromosome segregation protein [Opitutales bacterium]
MRTPMLKNIIAIACLVIVSDLVAEESINFNRDIRPILSNKCFHCHGPDEEDREEDLRLDIPDGEFGALTPRKDYSVIKPGEIEESELWFRIVSEYEDEVMPPPKS